MIFQNSGHAYELLCSDYQPVGPFLVNYHPGWKPVCHIKMSGKSRPNNAWVLPYTTK